MELYSICSTFKPGISTATPKSLNQFVQANHGMMAISQQRPDEIAILFKHYSDYSLAQSLPQSYTFLHYALSCFHLRYNLILQLISGHRYPLSRRNPHSPCLRIQFPYLFRSFASSPPHFRPPAGVLVLLKDNIQTQSKRVNIPPWWSVQHCLCKLLLEQNMVERFFNGGSTTSDHGQPQGGCCFSSNLITLLSGPPSCGKTSLLFQYAMNKAADCQSLSEGYIVFICNRRRFETKPPFLSQGIDGSSHIFQRIQIKYVDDYDDEGIKKYFAAFHLLHPFPLAVIIDDFGDFFLESKCQQRYNNSRGRDLAMVRVLALCHSALIHANKATACQLLLSDTHHGDSPRLFIYKRWISTIFTVLESISFAEPLTVSLSYFLPTARRSAKGQTSAQRHWQVH